MSIGASADSDRASDETLAFRIADQTLLAQPVQDIPVMSFPRSGNAMLGERGQMEKRKNHFIKLFLVVIHGQ